MSDAPTSSTRTRRIVLAVAILASFVAFLDGTVVNVALPAISRELGGGLVTQQWVIDAYLITLGSLILLAGSLSDAFGRILILRIGLIGFGAASIAIAAAPDALFLIVARAFQGAAGAFLVPSSLALITSTFRGAAQARAIGHWTALTTMAMLVGPVLGGVFTDFLSWRLVFLINVIPVAITVWLLPRTGIRDVRSPAASVDWLGAALCTLGLGGLVFALIEQPTRGWTSPFIWMPLAAGSALFTWFLLHQRTARSPILPLGLFRVRNFWTGNVATALIYAALALQGFVLAVFLQQGIGLSATLAGLASLPTTVMMVFLSSRAGAWAGRWGPRVFMTIGPLIMAGGCALLLTISADFDYWWQVLPGMVVFGVGLALTVSPLTSAILESIETARSGIASAVNNAVSRVAGLIAIAMVAILAAGTLDLEGFRRALVLCALLLVAGGVVSFAGIRNQVADRMDAGGAAPAA